MAAPLVDSTPAFVEEAYRKVEARLEKVRARLARPLTYAEKVLLGHLDDPEGVARVVNDQADKGLGPFANQSLIGAVNQHGDNFRLRLAEETFYTGAGNLHVAAIFLGPAGGRGKRST